MNDNRNIYLKMKSLNEAREILFEKFPPTSRLPAETVSVIKAVGRVLAEPVMARLSSPGFHSAAMDGIAVKAEITYDASETRPKELTVGTDAFPLNTGQIMPQNTDAVIMIENVNALDESRVQIEAPAFPWQNVRKMGEDIVATELLFPQNHIVTSYCLGAMLSGGIFSVPVRKKPNVLIMPTGSELVDWRNLDLNDLKPGQILESNSFVLGKLTESCGGNFQRHELLPDDPEKIKKAIVAAEEKGFDMVLIIGGSSAGSEDYAKRVIADLGEVFVHGVTIMPGKPVIIGHVNDKPAFGIPGYPVSAIIAFEQFVRPLICMMLTGLWQHHCRGARGVSLLLPKQMASSGYPTT
jgi:putative molybdopterin biosynthesis protein